MSLGSLNPDPPFSARTPITVNSLPLTFTCLLIGSVSGKRSPATVVPMTMTFRWSVTSSVVNAAPRSTV